jgi:primosomal protein N' (replication factor Y)
MQVASVVFASALPALDRVFDYLIPESLVGKVEFGHAVKVPFGSSKTEKTGYVIGLSDTSTFEGKLLEVLELVSPNQVLTREQFELVSAVAKRQAAIQGELLSVCLPKRSARADAKYSQPSSDTKNPYPKKIEPEVQRNYLIPGILDEDSDSHWSQLFIEECKGQLDLGHSSIVVLPDFRDLATFEEALAKAGMENIALRQTSSDSVVERWNHHLRAVAEPARIIYGTRNASFSPAKDLGIILVWDDGDDSHHEQGSPYWNTRDVLLQRSELENVSITFSSHSPSSEISRLIEIGYLKAISKRQLEPLVRIADSTERLDSESFALISKTLSEGKPVLIQISNLGFASALACVSCKEIKRCRECETPLWLNPSRELRCRNCKRTYEQICACGGKSFRAISQGSHALTEQLTRSFPKAKVLHSSGAEVLTRVDPEGVLVIATPGAEPSVNGGYSVILLADTQTMVGLPRLRALEQACRKWANAIAHLSTRGIAIAVGLTGDLASDLKSCDFQKIVRADMLERSELGLPPSTRIVSITGKNILDVREAASQLESVAELTLLPSSDSTTAAYLFSIANGAAVATEVQKIVSEVSKRSKHKLPGQRVLFINMDDNKVI